ncbi:MAG: MATE family efflux transporter [Clostridium sp.]
MNNQEHLGEESIVKLLIKYSIPAILSMVVTSMYNIADRVFIGAIPGVGPLAIAGLGVTMPVFVLILAFAMLIAMGGVTNISIKLGEGKKYEAEKILGNVFTLSIIVSVLITVIGLFFLDEILIMFGASTDTLIYAKEYMSVILIGTIFNLMGFTLNNAIRSDGNPKMAARTMITGCVINLILDPIFIFGFGLGIRGAAIATVISQAVLAVWIVNYFTKGQSVLKLKCELFKLDISIVKKIMAIGAAPFAFELASSLVLVLTNNALKSQGGDLAIGAMTAVTSIALMFLMPIFGINQGVQTIIGYNFGAKKYDRAKKALTLSIIVATVILILGLILVELMPGAFVGIFSNDETLMKIAVDGVRIYLITLPLLGISVVGPVYFQSIGKAKHSMFLSLLRQCILLIPLLIILPSKFGLMGVWLAQPAADIIASIVIFVFLKMEFKKENII